MNNYPVRTLLNSNSAECRLRKIMTAMNQPTEDSHFRVLVWIPPDAGSGSEYDLRSIFIQRIELSILQGNQQCIASFRELYVRKKKLP
jgi:hypothetical protein